MLSRHLQGAGTLPAPGRGGVWGAQPSQSQAGKAQTQAPAQGLPSPSGSLSTRALAFDLHAFVLINALGN